MKKARLNIKINVPDSFKIGECEKCPLCVKSSGESYPGCYWEKVDCKLGFNKATCPLEVEEHGKVNTEKRVGYYGTGLLKPVRDWTEDTEQGMYSK